MSLKAYLRLHISSNTSTGLRKPHSRHNIARCASTLTTSIAAVVSNHNELHVPVVERVDVRESLLGSSFMPKSVLIMEDGMLAWRTDRTWLAYGINLPDDAALSGHSFHPARRTISQISFTTINCQHRKVQHMADFNHFTTFHPLLYTMMMV